MIKTIIKKSTYSLLGLLITSHTFADDGDLTLQQTKTLKPNMEEMRETYTATKKSEFPKKTMEKQMPRKDESIEEFEKQPAEIDKQDFNEKDEKLDKLISGFEEKLAKIKTQGKKHTSHNSFESKLNHQDWEARKSDFFSNDTYIGYQVVDSYNNLAPLIITNVEQQDTDKPISVDVNVYVKNTKVDNHLIIGRTYAWENNSQSISYTSNGNEYKINFKLKPLRHYPKTDTIGILVPAKPTQLFPKTALQEKFKELLDAQQKVRLDFKKEVIDPVCEDESYNVLFQKCFGEISTNEFISQPQENEQLHKKTKDIQHKRLPLDKERQRRPRVKKTERQQALPTQLP